MDSDSIDYFYIDYFNNYMNNYQANMKKILMIAAAVLLFNQCTGGDQLSDAYGNFEAVETIISSEAAGKLLEFNIEEGEKIAAGAIIGFIDSTQLVLKRNQLIAAKSSAASKISGVISRIEVLKQKKILALKNKERIHKMLQDKAATEQQFDEISNAVEVIDKEIKSIETQNSPILSQVKSIALQIESLNDMIGKCTLINPVDGIVLSKFAEQYEITAPGKPLYKIANLDNIILRAYISGDQLPSVKLGQSAEVNAGQIGDKNHKYNGKVTWISSRAEFTPKIIQTKQERVNLVYAVKIEVANDGSLKIGMPAEVNFK